MEDLIIIALLIAGGAYFLTQQRKEETELEKPLTTSISTQTEPIKPDNPEQEKALESTLDQLIKNLRQLQREIK